VVERLTDGREVCASKLTHRDARIVRHAPGVLAGIHAVQLAVFTGARYVADAFHHKRREKFMRSVGILGFLSFLSSVASAQTYDFTGTVTGFNQYLPGLLSIGQAVTGSFSIDYMNAQTFSGAPGSPTFTATETGGNPYDPSSVPPATIFSMTIQAGRVSYSTLIPANAASTYSTVSGSKGILTAYEFNYPLDNVLGHYYNDSSLSLGGFNSSGLPVAGTSGTGSVENFGSGQFDNTVDFTISKVTAVQAPELDPSNGVAALAILSGCIVMLVGRHPRRRPKAAK
jgi:hypothetical protein